MTTIAETYERIGLKPSVAQLTLAKSLLGEPLLGLDEREIYKLCTNRDYEQRRYQEADVVVGRKGGKTEFEASPLLIHRAVYDEDDPGVYLHIAPSKSDQARHGWESITRQLERGFAGVIAETKESDGRIRLHNGNVIKVASANFRYLRGPRYKVVTVDEACYFVSDDPDEGLANPLEFILDSIVGGMIATKNPLLALFSTPWAKTGIVWEHVRDAAASPDRLVWRADTLTMNPSANRELMAKHRRDRGEGFYAREYLAQFSEDALAYIAADDIDAAIAKNMSFFASKPVRHVMGLDPGRKRDHFGAAIARKEGDSVCVVWCAEWKPGLLGGLKYVDILPELWQKAREYHVKKIASDQVDFGGLEASVPKSQNGVPEFEMERVMTGGSAGAELCDVTRALFAQRKLVLPDAPGLGDEFKRLTDYLTSGGGRDIRAKRGHDDRSRAVMLAIHQAYLQPQARELFPAHVISIPRGLPPAPTVTKDRYANLSPNDCGPENWWKPQD